METTPLHFDNDLRSDSPDTEWPSHHHHHGTRTSPIRRLSDTDSSSGSETSSLIPQEIPAASNYPFGRKSLSGISLRAFLLGLSLGVASVSTLSLVIIGSRLWRPPFFLSALSLFHFLEYYFTARYNTPAANIAAFLLSRNGRAYNIAHSVAFLESFVTSLFYPRWQARTSNGYTIALGLVMMVIGQTTRSAAMARAGHNFNHTVQTKMKEGHILVTTGIYAWFRHPSYFGFFWWGIGTQLVMSNCVCLLAYTAILWGFFRSRTYQEEEFLVDFFGDDYERYRRKTRVGIPFID